MHGRRSQENDRGDMATIFPRHNKNGTTTFRVMIRRKDIPILCLAFSSYKEAEKWVKRHERAYILDSIKYQKWIEMERLNLRREREFGA